MADEFTVDHTSTYADFLRLLSLGKRANGRRINTRTFNRRSTKKLSDLFHEVQQSDVILKLNLETQRIERHAQSVTVLIINPELKLVWIETQRRYPPSRKYPEGRTIKKEQEFTIRETRKRRPGDAEKLEKHVVCALRGLGEELRYWLGPGDQLISFEQPDEQDKHESSVYDGIQSRTATQRFKLITKRFTGADRLLVHKDYGGSDPRTAKNNWVETTIQAFPYDD